MSGSFFVCRERMRVLLVIHRCSDGSRVTERRLASDPVAASGGSEEPHYGVTTVIVTELFLGLGGNGHSTLDTCLRKASPDCPDPSRGSRAFRLLISVRPLEASSVPAGNCRRLAVHSP